MKSNILRYAMLVCLSASAVTVSCSESKSGETPDDPGKLTAITLTPSPLSLTVGQTAQLTATATPATASLEGLRWSSEDPKIARAGDDGTIEGIAVGKTNVKAKCGDVTASCEVTVTAAPIVLEKIELSVTFASVAAGKTLDITAKLVPENAAVEGPVVWKSDDTSKATVDQNGRITGVAEGRTVISATLGSVSASCDIEVYSPAATRDFTFLQLNLWEGIANVANGQEALIKQLAELKPDAASFCEFTSEDNARTILSAVADELYKRTGIRYTYTCKGGSGTRGLLTRHPVLSADAVNGNLWFYRTVIDFYGQQMAIYASHAYHMYYACYLPRGYGDGSSPYGWDKLADGPITDVDFILETRREVRTHADRQGSRGRHPDPAGTGTPLHLRRRPQPAFASRLDRGDEGQVRTQRLRGGMARLDDLLRRRHEGCLPGGLSRPRDPSGRDVARAQQGRPKGDAMGCGGRRTRPHRLRLLPSRCQIRPQKAQIMGPSSMISKSAVVEDSSSTRPRS